jgi:hypothetical protein
MAHSPQGEEQRPQVETEGAANNITSAPSVARFADPEKEKRFLRDQRGWLARILCSRRLSHDAWDPLVAPYNGGRWTA